MAKAASGNVAVMVVVAVTWYGDSAVNISVNSSMKKINGVSERRNGNI